MASSKTRTKSALPRRKRRKRPEAAPSAIGSHRRGDSVGTVVASRQADAGTDFVRLAVADADAPVDQDVVGILVHAVLRIADHHQEIRDGAVLSALRSVSQSGEPKSEPAARICDEIRRKLSENRVEGGTAARAAAELLELVIPYSDPQDRQCILRFLSLLVE